MTASPRPFAGKGAIVTGGAAGIGAAIARQLAQEGACVLIADVDGGAAAALVAELVGAGGSAHARTCDVGDEAQVIACFDELAERHGRIDVVVNNAGTMAFAALAQCTVRDWQETLRVDLIGAALFSKHALARMPRGGAIVNVASIHALATTVAVAPYAAAKAGLVSLTRSTAIEGRPLGIRANAVLPGAIETAMLRRNPNLASGAETLAPGDVGRPEDVAEAVAFLAGERARFVNGATLVVDGGRMAAL